MAQLCFRETYETHALVHDKVKLVPAVTSIQQGVLNV